MTRAREHLVHMPVGLANQLREDCFFWPRAGKVCWAIDTPIARVPNNATDSRAFAGAIRCWRRQSKGTAFLRSICSTLDHAAESRTASSVDRRSRDSRVDENPAMCPTPATAAVATPFERADSDAAVARSRPEGRQSGTQSRRGMLEADQVLWRAVRPLSTGGPWPLRGRTLRWSAGRGL